jgi:Ca-activated chloride channel family protein
MEDRYVVANDPALAKEITATSLRFGVLCRFTAFVAVDRSSVVNPGGQVHGIVQPVEEPEGWEMNSTLLACAAAMPMCGGAYLPGAAEQSGDVTSTDYQAFMRGFRGEIREPKFRKATKQSPPTTKQSPPPQAEPQSPAESMSTVELLQRLSTVPNDAKSRREMLQTILTSFEQRVKEASASGLHPDIAKRLDVALQQVRQLLNQKHAKAAEVHAVWDEVVAALKEYEAATGSETPPRREEFWA